MSINIVNHKENKDEMQIKDLLNSSNPCVVWGKGDLANNVIKMLIRKGKNIDYIFTDIPSTEEKEIDIKEINDLTNVGNEAIDLVVGHSRYELAVEIQKKYKNIKRVYMFSNPFEAHDTVTTVDFVNRKIADFEIIEELLDDSESKENLNAYINSRINKDVDFIKNLDNSYFNNSIFSVDEKEIYVDVGAYNGDTLRSFLKECHGKYRFIYAIEPEKNAFLSLEKYTKEKNLNNIELINLGCFSSKTTLLFDNSIDTSSHVVDDSSLGIKIEVDTLDDMLNEATLIKIGQQGPVAEIIKGAKRTLKQNKPKLAIVVGLDVEHLLYLPLLVKQINPDYKVYLRFLGKLPSRLTLFAI